MDEKSDYQNLVSIFSYEGSFGAAIGDIIGSIYEFSMTPKTPKFETPLITSKSHFTDDTVLTAAVATYLLNKTHGADIASELTRWVCKYPGAGYGSGFFSWTRSPDRRPYYSYGNGAAMRVSPVAYFAQKEEEVVSFSQEVTKVTHNHPEGIKGAETLAVCIYKALHGESRERIGEYASSRYDLSLDYPSMRKFIGQGEITCQVTVPQALWCFLHSDSFLDAMRLAMAIRFDSDTLADMVGALAEAYYQEIPEFLLLEARRRLPQDVLVALSAIPKSHLIPVRK